MSDKTSFENLMKKVQNAVSRLGASKTAVETLSLAMALSAGSAKAEKTALQDPKVADNEHFLDVEEMNADAANREDTADYLDYAQTTENDEYQLAQKMGLKAAKDRKGKIRVVSMGPKTRMIVDAKHAGDLKAAYIRRQREAFYRENAGKVIIRRKTLSEVRCPDGGVRLGGYSFSSKSINLNKLVKGKNETLSAKDEAIISKVNCAMPRTRLHERGHEYADRQHVYGPGISPEQRAIVNMNDEMAAVASELYLCICYYRQKIEQGVPAQRALQVFDQGDIHFAFFQQAVAAGMDPLGPEGQKLMVRGTCKMWTEQYAKGYQAQLVTAGLYNLDDTDIGGIVVGDRVELKKRIRDIWAAVGNNPGIRELGLPLLSGLEKYVEMDKVSCLPENIKQEVRRRLAVKIEDKTGLSEAEINAVCRCLNQTSSDAERQKELTDYLQNLNAAELLKEQQKPQPTTAEPETYGPRPWGRDNCRW